MHTLHKETAEEIFTENKTHPRAGGVLLKHIFYVGCGRYAIMLQFLLSSGCFINKSTHLGIYLSRKNPKQPFCKKTLLYTATDGRAFFPQLKHLL